MAVCIQNRLVNVHLICNLFQLSLIHILCHSAVLLQRIYDGSYGRSLLADGDINTLYALTLLVDDGVDGNCGLTCLSVADNQLTLSASDRNHGIDCLDSGLKRGIYGFTGNNAACHTLDFAVGIRLHGSLAIDRLTQRIYNTSQQRIARRNLNYMSCCPDLITLTDAARTKQYSTYVVLLQICLLYTSGCIQSA